MKSSLRSQESIWHIAGIGGVGMNALAQLLLQKGCRVSGSDRLLDQGIKTPVLEQLERAGVTLYPQDGSGISEKTIGWVASSAIEDTNPERDAAVKHGVRVWHRAELLADMVQGEKCFAVVGTSGKTTVTGMLGWTLSALGMDPTMVNGGAVLNWRDAHTPGNVRIGQSEWWVVEVDESDRSLLRFSPDYALITNLSIDHFSMQETVSLFRKFVRSVKKSIFATQEVLSLLFADKQTMDNVSATLVPVENVEDLFLKIPGAHNVENASLVYAVCRALGYEKSSIRASLSSFKGIERRLECVGEVGGITVFDEYAHNPAKIHAAWTAVANRHAPVLGVWRPHGYGPLKDMANELVDMFKKVCRKGDKLFILPVYYAGGTADRSFSAATFTRQLQQAGVPARYAESYIHLEEQLLTCNESGTAILVMGARDPELPVFSRRLMKNLALRSY